MTDSVSRRPLDQDVFDEWPAAARALFDGSSLGSKTGFTASLLTTDANGHVRTSLLGVGELYAPDSRTLCIALWPQSRAAGVLTRSGRGALTFVCEDAFYQVQLQFEPLASADGSSSGLAHFIGFIDTGETQRVRYARLTGGITFELGEESEAVLDRWEQQIEHLKQAAAAARS
ncbi:hypothetical protein [Paraburkholderia phenazinium]|jgi:hypothetical protein|uniref:Pyridoxamine 5'-phosphate oxidase n=1 Tax=Paraburkholderia phenazinium TaxID=60549 RepID=A0A1G7X704_9BURK|nr:hypothetical protein [Paraburkholderia phenazinium]SDG79978.1 hypothetical protein SAMN05216466_105224 [Paraburkholderia phenazinium]